MTATEDTVVGYLSRGDYQDLWEKAPGLAGELARLLLVLQGRQTRALLQALHEAVN